jgi:molybdenum cofactor cytidylyltransferase
MRFFAIIPAAGHSTRMGRVKLLMEVEGKPLIVRAIEAWQQSKINAVVVVIRPDDQALADMAQAAGAEVAIPASAPPDMKASVQAGLSHVTDRHAPDLEDAFLVAPADMPWLSSAVINRLIEEHVARSNSQILVPIAGGRRGHPALFPFALAEQVHQLADNEGLDAIVARYGAANIDCSGLVPSVGKAFADIDTPDDYSRWSKQR